MKNGAVPDKKTKYPLFYAAAGHLIFIISYIFFLFFFKNTKAEFIYPLYLAPFAVYAFLFCASAGYRAITGKNAASFFNTAQNILVVFALLTAAPLAVKMTLPDPHNLLIRKLELTLAAPYVLFVMCTSAYFLYSVYKNTDINTVPSKKIFLYITAFFFIFYFFISLWFNYANQPTGDEPHYLMVTHSIVNDGDLNLKNNYENRDYEKFYDRQLKPQGADYVKGDKIYSYHPVIPSVITAPFYAAGGRAGVVVFVNFLCGLFLGMIFIFLNSVINNKGAAAAGSIITGTTMPVFAFINNISTEIMIGVLILSAYMFLKGGNRQYLKFAVVLAIMPWVHIRVMPVYASLAVLFFFYNRKNITSILVFGIVQLLSGAIFAGTNYMIYGAIVPSYANAGASSVEFLNPNITGGITAFFIDRQLGLFAYAPVYVFIFSGFFYLIKQKNKTAVESAVIFIPYLIFISSWYDWGSGSSSPRYFVPVFYIISLTLAVFITLKKVKALKLLYTVLLSATLAITAVIAVVPWFRWDTSNGENWIITVFDRVAGFNANVMMPSLKNPGDFTLLKIIFWIAIIISINIFAVKKTKFRSNYGE